MDGSEKEDLPEHVANAARVRYQVLVGLLVPSRKGLLEMSNLGPNSRNRGFEMERVKLGQARLMQTRTTMGDW